MTVVMLPGFSVMTRTYSCCLSTGHGAVIYRIVSLSGWRSGDGVVVDVNARCAHLGSTVCSQLLGAHAITGCDTVSYPFGKGKASMLNTLKEGYFPGLFDVLGEEGASQEDLMAVGEHFFVALCGQPSSSLHDAGPLQFVHSQSGKAYAYHVTAADRLESLPPRETSSFTDATMEGSRPAWSSERFHHIIWLGDPIRANLSKHL